MPLITAAVGAESFDTLTWIITNNVTLHYGKFIQTVIDFLIIAFVVFIFMKAIMSAKQAGSELSEHAKKKLARKLRKSGATIVAAAEETAIAAPPEAVMTAKEAAPAAIPEVVADPPAAEPKPTIEELLLQIKDLLEKQIN